MTVANVWNTQEFL